MQKLSWVNVLNTLDHLGKEHEWGFGWECATILFKQFLETGPEQVHNEGVVVAFLSWVIQSGNAFVSDCGVVEQGGEDFGLMGDLWVFGVDFFEFDGKLLSRVDVDGMEDLTEWSLRYFFDDFEFFGN